MLPALLPVQALVALCSFLKEMSSILSHPLLRPWAWLASYGPAPPFPTPRSTTLTSSHFIPHERPIRGAFLCLNPQNNKHSHIPCVLPALSCHLPPLCYL